MDWFAAQRLAAVIDAEGAGLCTVGFRRDRYTRCLSVLCGPRRDATFPSGQTYRMRAIGSYREWERVRSVLMELEQTVEAYTAQAVLDEASV
jgi:hypothetical protein